MSKGSVRRGARPASLVDHEGLAALDKRAAAALVGNFASIPTGWGKADPTLESWFVEKLVKGAIEGDRASRAMLCHSIIDHLEDAKPLPDSARRYLANALASPDPNAMLGRRLGRGRDRLQEDIRRGHFGAIVRFLAYENGGSYEGIYAKAARLLGYSNAKSLRQFVCGKIGDRSTQNETPVEIWELALRTLLACQVLLGKPQRQS